MRNWHFITPDSPPQWGWTLAKILASVALAIAVWPNPLLLLALVICILEINWS